MASGALELPVLGADVEFGVAMRGSWGLAEMPVHLSALARTGEEDSVTALGGVQGQLVKGEDLAPGLEDATPGAAAHWQSTHLQFGHLLDTNIVGYSPHDHSCFALPARKLHLPDHLGNGERWPVGAAHEQSLEDSLIEGGVSFLYPHTPPWCVPRWHVPTFPLVLRAPVRQLEPTLTASFSLELLL